METPKRYVSKLIREAKGKYETEITKKTKRKKQSRERPLEYNKYTKREKCKRRNQNRNTQQTRRIIKYNRRRKQNRKSVEKPI